MSRKWPEMCNFWLEQKKINTCAYATRQIYVRFFENWGFKIPNSRVPWGIVDKPRGFVLALKYSEFIRLYAPIYRSLVNVLFDAVRFFSINEKLDFKNGTIIPLCAHHWSWVKLRLVRYYLNMRFAILKPFLELNIKNVTQHCCSWMLIHNKNIIQEF